MHGTAHELTGQTAGPLRRVLPLVAFVVALLAAWLQPSPAALAGIAGARTADAAVVDTIGAIERIAVKPQAPAQLQATAKKRLDTHGGPAPAPVATPTAGVAPTDYTARLHGAGRERTALPARPATVAQPRAPPPSRTLTPAV